MSGILKLNSPANNSFVEGTVMSVDVLRFCCEVKTLFGQRLINVQWLMSNGGNNRGGDHCAPSIGDRVLICFSLSYPIIIGYLPSIRILDILPVPIDSGLNIDTGNLSSSPSDSSRSNPGKPEDLSIGDRVWTSKGGGLIALLRHGTILLKSSKLAQILISKFDDLVRIVGRNIEIFSDVFVDVSYNVKGRIYRFIGYSENPSKTRSDNYSYQEIIGDTSIGEYAKQNGFSTGLSGAPAANSKIKKLRVVNNGNEVYSHVLDLNGSYKDTVTAGAATSSIEQTSTMVELTTTNGGTSRITIDGTKVELDHGDSTAVFDAGKVQINHGTSNILINTSGIYLSSNGHFVNVTAAGVQTG